MAFLQGYFEGSDAVDQPPASLPASSLLRLDDPFESGLCIAVLPEYLLIASEDPIMPRFPVTPAISECRTRVSTVPWTSPRSNGRTTLRDWFSRAQRPALSSE